MKVNARFTFHDLVQIEIDAETLEGLFSKGVLCAADLRCLNRESKKCIWAMCLNTCAKRVERQAPILESEKIVSYGLRRGIDIKCC